MKTCILGIAAFTILSACDKGTAPPCATGDSTCATVSSQSGAGTKTTGSSNGSGNGNTETGGGSDSSSVDTWELAWDTGSSVKTVSASSLQGTPSVPGGQARGLVFYLVDSTLHMVASSDGDRLDTYNRKTIFDVKVLSSDTLMFRWDSPSDQGLTSKAVIGWEVVDPETVRHVVTAKMTTVARTLESSITTRKGAKLKIWVKARSGSVLISEDSLTRLDISGTRPLLFAGGNLKSIGSDPFLVEIP